MGLLDLHAEQAGIAEPPLQALPRTLGERVSATAAATFAPDRYFTIGAARGEMWQRAVDELHAATGEKLLNPYGVNTSEEMLRLGNQPAVTAERSQKIIQAARTARAQGNDSLFDPENIDRYIGEEATRRRDKAASYEGTGNGVLNFLASAVLETATPHGLVGLIIPATRLPSAAASAVGRTFLGNVAREAAFQGAANAGLQAAAEGLDYLSRSETGTSQTPGEIVTNVAGAFVIGGAIGGGVRALHLKRLGLPEKVLAEAPLEVRDAFRVIEADALYSGQNRLGVDPLLHERYQGKAMDAVMRGRPVDLADLSRTADTPLTALGTILRQAPDQIRVEGLANTLDRVRALPDTEIEAVLREARPDVFKQIDDIARRSAQLDARQAALRDEMDQIGLADVVDVDTGARLQDIETQLAKKGLRKAARLDLERERETITQSIDPQGRLADELKTVRADFFPEQQKALAEIAEARAALQREAEAARSVVAREVDQARRKIGDLTIGNRFADEAPADLLAREFGTTPADLGGAITRADALRQARMVREIVPEGIDPRGRQDGNSARNEAPTEITPEVQRALDTEVQRILQRTDGAKERLTNLVESIRDVLRDALKPGHQKTTADLGKVAPWLSAEAKAAGLDVEGFAHTLDADAVRHIRKQHGDPKVEEKRGQIALTDDDFARIPEILAAPDRIVFGAKTKPGRDIIGYVKRLDDGTTLYLEEARTGRKRLAAVSMRKVPATMNVDTVASTLDPNGGLKGSDGGIGLKIIEPPQSSRASLDGAARELEQADQAVKDAQAAASCVSGGAHL